MVNKKGQEMSVATLVLIVIGIVVLVMLILGFSMGWSNLWGKINILGGGSNVETAVQACKLAASSDSTFSFCSEFKKVTIDGKTQYINCNDDRVTGLDKKLPCAGDAPLMYCNSTYNAASAADKAGVNATVVNGKSCSDRFLGK